MDVFIKVEECGGDDFGGSPVTSTVLSPVGGGQLTPQHHSQHLQDTDQSLVDLGIDISSDFGMTSLFDDKKTFFDPAAPMAEPVTSFQHMNSSPVKKEYAYEVTAVPAAVVDTSTSGSDVGCYLTSPVTSVPSPPTTADLLGASPPPPFYSNGGGLNSSGITILYEQKGVETSTRQTIATSPQRKYLNGKATHKTNNNNHTPPPDQNFAAADSNSGSPARPYVPCKVCGDKASGYHYGVTSCEGCKGFFRRSIQKQIEYRCLRDGKCLVIRLNRNRCQHCRFKKCLAVGMSRDSVRYGRVPKRSRERQAAEESRGNVVVSEADQSAWEGNEAKEKHLTQIIRIIADIYRMFCAYAEEKIQNIVRKPAIFSLDEFQSGSIDASGNTQISADSLEQQKIVMWQHFAVMLTPSIQRIVEMAKRVPGFQDLTQDDQIILIKQGFFEIWMVHIAKLVSPQDNTITFNDGSYITRQQVELMFDYEFVSALFNFVTSFNNMQLDDTEIALFSAIVLLMSERPGIYDHKTIDQQQEKIIEALKFQFSLNHAANPHMFATLMMKLPELRALGAKHMEHLEWFRANWTQLKLPPLFAETFDIPNREQILQQ